MKRGAALTRTTPMPRPSAPMPRTEWLSRPAAVRPRLRQRSKKTAKVYLRERIPLLLALLTEHPVCQIQWDEGCTGHAVDVHELLSRGRGGSITARANCVTGCRHCHEKVTQNPAEAEKRGWLLPSGRPSKAVPR